MNKLLNNQKGVGAILILIAIIFVIVIVAIVFFLLNGPSKEDTTKTATEESQTESTSISEEDVPLKICETGDPEQCNDPVSNEDVDNISTIEDEYP